MSILNLPRKTIKYITYAVIFTVLMVLLYIIYKLKHGKKVFIKKVSNIMDATGNEIILMFKNTIVLVEECKKLLNDQDYNKDNYLNKKQTSLNDFMKDFIHNFISNDEVVELMKLKYKITFSIKKKEAIINRFIKLTNNAQAILNTIEDVDNASIVNDTCLDNFDKNSKNKSSHIISEYVTIMIKKEDCGATVHESGINTNSNPVKNLSKKNSVIIKYNCKDVGNNSNVDECLNNMNSKESSSNCLCKKCILTNSINKINIRILDWNDKITFLANELKHVNAKIYDKLNEYVEKNNSSYFTDISKNAYNLLIKNSILNNYKEFNEKIYIVLAKIIKEYEEMINKCKELMKRKKDKINSCI